MGRTTIRRFGSASLEILLSIASLIVFLSLILPIFVIFFLVCYVWRLILIAYVRLSGMPYVRIMDGKNPVLAIDDMHGKPLCTIVGMGAFDGRLDFSSASVYVSNVVSAKDPTGRLLNPEFQQYYEEWRGFIWWKWEMDFRLSDHVKIWDSSKLSNGIAEEEELIKIMRTLESLPFQKGKSPWEVIILRNLKLRGVSDEQNPKTAIIFRFHHGLADGIAMMQQFMEFIFDDRFEKVVHPTYIQRNWCQKGLHIGMAALQLPYHFFKQGIVAYDVNDWHLPENQLRRDVSKAWSNRIPIEAISRTKSQHGVGFTAVLISAISGALRKAMMSAGVTVPKKIHAILPLPWPAHPRKLCNHWSYGFMTLPVGTEDRMVRLQKCHKYVNELKGSPSPAVNFAILTAFNLLPTWVIRKATLTNYFPTVILSNFPGPPSGTTGIGGLPLVDTCFTGGPLRGNIGISITILSFDGFLRIVIGVDKAIFPREEMTLALVSFIEDEFQLL